MSLIVVGLNHRSAPLELIERLRVTGEQVPKALLDLRSRDHISEAVRLSTCNRFEVYAVVESYHGGVRDVRTSMSQSLEIEPAALSRHAYELHDASAVAHLFAVASGLDSAVIGESEILGQVRQAWVAAEAEGAAGQTLRMLFRHAVEVGKRVRTQTGIGRAATSVSSAAIALADARLNGSLAGRRVLVLGAGRMGQGVVRALAGSAEVLVANRTASRAEALAELAGGQAVPLTSLLDVLATVDVLLTATAAQRAILEHADLEGVVAARAGRPLLIVDLAVPRNVDPAARELPGVSLLDMNDIRAFAAAGVAARRREAELARALIEEEVVRWQEASTGRTVAPLVRDLRARVEAVRSTEVDRLTKRMSETERAAVDATSRAIVAKLLHQPTVRLKESAGTARGDRLAEGVRYLFDL